MQAGKRRLGRRLRKHHNPGI